MGTLTTLAALVPDPGRGVPCSALRRQTRPSEQTGHTAGSAFLSVLPVKVSGTPLLPSLPTKEPEAIVGPACTHTHTRDTHGCSHSTCPTVLVRAVKWNFTNSTGGWVTTKVTKNKTSVLCHMGSQLRTWERNEVPGRTCREPGKDRNGPQRCPPAAAWVCAPTARTARKAQHTEGHIRRNLKREGS